MKDKPPYIIQYLTPEGPQVLAAYYSPQKKTRAQREYLTAISYLTNVRYAILGIIIGTILARIDSNPGFNFAVYLFTSIANLGTEYFASIDRKDKRV